MTIPLPSSDNAGPRGVVLAGTRVVGRGESAPTLAPMGKPGEDAQDAIARAAKRIVEAALRPLFAAMNKVSEAGTQPARDAMKRLGDAQPQQARSSFQVIGRHMAERLAEGFRRALWWVTLGARMLMRFDPRALARRDSFVVKGSRALRKFDPSKPRDPNERN